MNCTEQIAAMKFVSPKKSGIAAATTNAILQYRGTMSAQSILPRGVTREGAAKNSMRMLL